MPPPDVEKMAAAVVAMVQASLAPFRAENAALQARIAVLEARAPVPGPPGTDGAEGRPGTSVDRADVEAMVETRVHKAVAALPVPPTATEQIAANVQGARELVDLLVKDAVSAAVERIPAAKNGADGQSVSVEELAPVIQAEVQKAVSELPKPKDGQDGANGTNGTSVDRSDVERMVSEHVEKAVAKLPPPKDGQDGASVDAGEVVSTVMGLLDARVEKALADIPAPQDGRSVTVEDVAPLIESAVMKAVAALPPAKDGVGLSGALLGRDGHLVVTMTDGSVRDVGLVMGRDVDMSEVRSLIADEVAKIPRPQDGAPGAPGRDGTLENLAMVFDGERTVSFAHKDGTPVEGGVIRFPVTIDRGVYKAGTSYEHGDGVTFGGSWFIAQRQTLGTEKPEDASGAFRLSVKRGQDGKSIMGKQGPEGRPGKDSPFISPERPRF